MKVNRLLRITRLTAKISSRSTFRSIGNRSRGLILRVIRFYNSFLPIDSEPNYQINDFFAKDRKNERKPKIFCLKMVSVYLIKKDESLYIIIRRNQISPTSEMKE
jgi:hypothetical protein